ncbi:MAG: DegV family protein [Dehalococcoidia bacterium]|jgi:DegV family protein with EDD domain
MVKVICDSTGDIRDLAQEYDISLIPLNVLFGEESYADGVTITPEEFYKRLVTDSRHPTTSAPAPGQFVELYKKLAKETDEIVVLTISGGLSATAESAIQAKELIGNLCKVEVVDSLMTCGGLGLLALKAARAAKKGDSLKEIVAMLKDALPRIHAYMIFDTLEYLLKGGRIGRVQAMLGGLLKINPIATLKDGLVTPVARARSRTKAKDMLVQLIKDIPNIEEMFIEDATTTDERQEIEDRIAAFFPKEKMHATKVSPVIGVHSGPNVLAVCTIASA